MLFCGCGCGRESWELMEGLSSITTVEGRLGEAWGRQGENWERRQRIELSSGWQQ